MKNLWMIVGLVGVVSSLAGCATTRVDLVSHGRVKVDYNNKSVIFPVFVYQEGEIATITGNIHNIPASIRTGKVLIEIVGADGKVLYQAEAAVKPGYSPGHSSRARGISLRRKPYFSVRFPMVIPNNATVRVDYQK